MGFSVNAPARDAAARPSLGHMLPGVEPGPGGMGAGPEQAEGLTRLLQAEEAVRAGGPLDPNLNLKPADAAGSPFWAACGTKARAGGKAEPILAPAALLQAREEGLPGTAQSGSNALAREHSKVRRGAVDALQRRTEADAQTDNAGSKCHLSQVNMFDSHLISACCLLLHCQAQHHQVCFIRLLETVLGSTLALFYVP